MITVDVLFILTGAEMAKKVTLSELDQTEKKKLTKVSFLSLGTVFLLCIFIVSCFACSQDSGNTNTEMSDEQQKLYWKGLLPDTEWTVSTTEQNNGILEGQEAALNAKVKYESTTDKFTIYFTLEGVNIFHGNLELTSSKATITAEGKTWNAKFSEKNDVLYLRITDSTNKNVDYTSPKP